MSRGVIDWKAVIESTFTGVRGPLFIGGLALFCVLVTTLFLMRKPWTVAPELKPRAMTTTGSKTYAAPEAQSDKRLDAALAKALAERSSPAARTPMMGSPARSFGRRGA